MNAETPRRRLAPAAAAAALACAGLLHDNAWSQPAPSQDEGSTPRLRLDLELRETLPASARDALPVFLSGESLSGHTDQETELKGDAQLRRGDTVIRADQLRYDRPDDTARANGQVHLNRAGDVFEGPALELQVQTFKGTFTQPTFQFLKNGGLGDASRADFIDDKHTIVHDARYSTCRRDGPEWLPDWVLRASRIHLDSEAGVGRAEDGVLTFKDFPVLPVPGISFPLGDQRKSGLLPPTIDVFDSVSGFVLQQPYYLNLAPNYDATLEPTLMTRRGIALGGEFRYLERVFGGQIRGNVMPSDRLRHADRWGISAQHVNALPGGATLGLNLNRVSDDNYWRDFPHATEALTGRLLPNDGRMAWSAGPYAAQVRTLKWQTLQDVGSPIVPPYDRLPQLSTRYAREGLGGFDVSLDLDYTRFRADRRLTGQPNGERSFALAQLSYPWVRPGGFITPSLKLNSTAYSFTTPLANGATRASRSVPTFSLDSGLVFERNARFFGRDLRQTLEPRAYYVYTPYRDQHLLPSYDTAAKDFNFDSIYSDSPFVGNDRIADNNLLTLGVTTRLFDPETGGEAARLGIAQRLRFSDQRVTLPGMAPTSERLSDLLLGASLNWSAPWRLDTNVQYNPKTGRSLRTTVGGRYSPGNYRVVNAAYRLQRGSSELVDLGWQWPLNDLWGDRGEDLGAGRGQGPGRWYSVGRLNFSLMDRKLVDMILGFEYDAGCWIGRVVFDRLQSSTTTSSSRITLQLEFIGFTRLGVGANPLKKLRDNIPRYQYLREQASPPSRFSNYD